METNKDYVYLIKKIEALCFEYKRKLINAEQFNMALKENLRGLNNEELLIVYHTLKNL